MSYGEAAMLDPLCIAIAAIDRAGVRMGESLLVSGTTTIAMLVIMLAKATGIGPIVVLDTRPGRLDKAKALGADHTFWLDPKWTEDTLAQAIIGELGHEGADSSIECTGVASALRVDITATKQGGVCCRIGGGEPDQIVPISAFALRDITLRGVHRLGAMSSNDASSFYVYSYCHSGIITLTHARSNSFQAGELT